MPKKSCSEANQNLRRNVLKTILKTSKVNVQIYRKRNPKFCYTKSISTKYIN